MLCVTLLSLTSFLMKAFESFLRSEQKMLLVATKFQVAFLLDVKGPDGGG